MNRPILVTAASMAVLLTAGGLLKLNQVATPVVNSQLLESPGIFTLAKAEQGSKAYIERLHMMRANPFTGTIEPEWIWKAKQEDHILRMQNPRGNLNLQWETMGPNNFGGRTRALLIDMNNPDRMYTGGVTGGLWISNSGGKSWFPYDGDDTLEAIGIVSLCQASNGDIYVGTGEGQISGGGTHRVTTGFLGEGIWKSTDGGNTFQHLTATTPSGNHNSTSSDWIYVNAIGAHPSDPNVLIAGTKARLYKSLNAGQTWTPIVLAPPIATFVEDIDIDPDGVVHAVLGGQYYKGDMTSFAFTKVNGTGGFPSGGASRYQIAVAPSDANYVYAVGCNGSGATSGVYQSKDKGTTWTAISPSGFNPTGEQGGYDMEIAVNPADKERIYIGGQLSVYQGLAVNNNGIVAWNFYPISNWFSSTSSDDQYIHADHHRIIFHPDNPNIMYVGTDGGVYQTKNATRNYPDLPDFTQLNKGYNVTQFFSVAGGLDGSVLGGTQDNGTIYVAFDGNTPLQGREVSGGDGGFADISKWNPNAIFGESNMGNLRRSANRGSGMATFFDQYIDSDLDGTPGGNNQTPFYTAFRLWEEYGEDDDNYLFYKEAADAVIQNSSLEFANNDSLIVVGPDTFEVATMRHTYQGEGRIALGTTGEIWLGTNALDFSQESTWYEIAKSATGFSSTATCMDWSSDGDILYVGTENGQVFRIDGLRHAHLNYDTLGTDVFNPAAAGIVTTRIGAFGRFVCDVAVDKNDDDHVVVALGQYGITNYVYRCTNASTTIVTTDFNPIQGSGSTKLPSMPVYSCLIDVYDSKNIIVGTELGIYSSTNSGASWARESAGMPAAAAFMLRQELIDSLGSGCYVMYAATHGRGFWRATTLTPSACNTAIPSGGVAEPKVLAGIQVFPNPASTQTTLTIGLNDRNNVTVLLYDLRGVLVRRVSLGSLGAGQHSATFPVTGLTAGTYVAVVEAGDARLTKKLVITR